MSHSEDMDSKGNKSNEDDELSLLLNSSLSEFGKSNMNPTADDDCGTDGADEEFDPEAARKAAAEFKIMLQQLTEVQKVFVQQMSPDAKNDSAVNADSQAFADSSSSEFMPGGSSEQEDLQFAQTFLKSMQYLSDKAQNVQEAKSPEQLADAMKHLANDEAFDNDFMPFINNLMGGLLSKDMLYPPMKEMCDKFPAWLVENKEKLDEETIVKYEQQIKLMQEVCSEFESEKPDETDEDKSQRFDRLVLCMQKMQACGHPPEELIGTLPAGWNFDTQLGIPQVVEAEKAAESCCLM